ncbi:MAG: hypothetical protein HPKKFMNG_00447 [Planctomycetes bacterium]|nr:hypothetical protein [Planctomycetota bacterium]
MLTVLRFGKDLLRVTGLTRVELVNLGRTVVLAGQNGAGKSRILDNVMAAAGYLAKAVAESSTHQINLGGYRKMLEKPSSAPGEQQHAKNMIQSFEDQIELSEWALRNGRREDLVTDHRFVRLTCKPVRERILDWNGLTDHDRQLRFEELVRNIDAAHAFERQHLVIQWAAMALYNSRHPDGKTSERDVERARSLSALIDSMLGTPISYGLDGLQRVKAHLFDMPYDKQQLSDGQLTLLAWAICVWAYADQTQNQILLIDEPDAHVHPDACIKALDAFADSGFLGPSGQIWIATHSLPVVAHVGIRNTWFVEKGAVTWGGKEAKQGIERLLGGENGRERLHALLGDVDALAAHEFACESLSRPHVASDRNEDPQCLQVADGLEASSCTLLDFGAGKGRLAAALNHLGKSRPELRKVKYCAFDVSDEHRQERETNASSIGGEVVGDLSNFVGHFDFVVLCNVLHEIPPRQWPKTFESIHRVLKQGGQVIVVEDQYIPTGELPHDSGFILLAKTELELLLGGNAQVLAQFLGKGERLSRFMFERESLVGISEVSVRAALKAVLERSEKRVREIRIQQGGDPYKDGRLHMLHAMQLANATLALTDIDMSPPKHA